MSYLQPEDYDADEILRDEDVSEYIDEEEMDIPEVGETRIIEIYDLGEEDY